jgi:predicted nucleic acid-binding protein
MIVLDTNVLSEVMRVSPSPTVLRWLAKQTPARVFTTTITQAEILYGLGLLPAGKRRATLEAAAAEMFEKDFTGRILPFDSDAARVFPQIVIARRKAGRPCTQFDAQIASIARCRGAALATRNVGDFEHCGVALIDPWDIS